MNIVWLVEVRYIWCISNHICVSRLCILYLDIVVCIYIPLQKRGWEGGVHYKREVVCSQTGDVRPTIFPTDGASLPSFNLFSLSLFLISFNSFRKSLSSIFLFFLYFSPPSFLLMVLVCPTDSASVPSFNFFSLPFPPLFQPF